MSEVLPSSAANRSVFDGLHDVAARVVGVVRGLFLSLAYLRARGRRLPAPRIGLAGPAEGVALTALVLGLVAAAMILLDPLVLGLRAYLSHGVLVLAQRITDLGLGSVILWPLGLAILYLLALSPTLDDMGRRVTASVIARVGFLFISIATVGLSVAIVKNVLGRARPYMAAVMPGPDRQLTFDPLAWKPSFASFPSGHSTTVFATAVAFGALFPKARRILIALAVVVAGTRIVLGVHFPSDVIAGAAIGTAFVLFMVKVFAARRVVFAVAADGRVHPMAGPSAHRLGHVLLPARAHAGQDQDAHPKVASEARAPGSADASAGDARKSAGAGDTLEEARS